MIDSNDYNKDDPAYQELIEVREKLRGFDERVGVRVLAGAQTTEGNIAKVCIYVACDEEFAKEMYLKDIASSLCKKLGINSLQFESQIEMASAHYSPTISFYISGVF